MTALVVIIMAPFAPAAPHKGVALSPFNIDTWAIVFGSIVLISPLKIIPSNTTSGFPIGGSLCALRQLCFIVIKTAPFAAAVPYNAIADSPFKTFIFSMSLGLIVFKFFLKIRPSTTTNGLVDTGAEGKSLVILEVSVALAVSLPCPNAFSDKNKQNINVNIFIP